MQQSTSSTEPLTVLVADDEPHAREGMRALLATDPEVEVCAVCGGVAEAAAAIERHRPDLMLLDIQMTDGSGFDLLDTLDEAVTQPIVVFVTAFDRFVLQAFDADALDYVLKPFTDERFHRAVGRAKVRCRERRLWLAAARDLAPAATPAAIAPAATAPEMPRGSFLRRFAVKHGDDLEFVDAARVEWIEAVEYCARIHIAGRSHLLRGTLASFERQLDPRQFLRVHRSAIVNLTHVQRLRRWFQGASLVVLASGVELPVSRSRRPALQHALEYHRP